MNEKALKLLIEKKAAELLLFIELKEIPNKKIKERFMKACNNKKYKDNVNDFCRWIESEIKNKKIVHSDDNECFYDYKEAKKLLTNEGFDIKILRESIK